MRAEIKIGLAMSAVIIAIWIASGTFSPTKQAQEQAEAKTIAAAANAAQKIKNSLRDPDSFRLTSVLIMATTGAACYEYRARNGFGGMNSGRAVLSSSGVLTTNESDGFSDAWRKSCSRRMGTEDVSAVSLLIQ